MATKKAAKPARKRRGDFAILHRATAYPRVVEAFEVRVLARGEGYAMVRRKGCAPFIVDERELQQAPNTEKLRTAADYCREIRDVIVTVENRCLAADGPVTPTSEEITDSDLRRIWRAASKGARL